MLDKAPNGKVSDLLNVLDETLSACDVECAVDLFQADCYWRDLVTFTWNIKTMEGKDQVRDMLKACLATTKPSNWKIAMPTELLGIGNRNPTFPISAWSVGGPLRMLCRPRACRIRPDG